MCDDHMLVVDFKGFAGEFGQVAHLLTERLQFSQKALTGGRIRFEEVSIHPELLSGSDVIHEERGDHVFQFRMLLYADHEQVA